MSIFQWSSLKNVCAKWSNCLFHECGIPHTFAQRWVMPHSSNLCHENDWFRTKICGFQWYLDVVFCKTVIPRYTGTCYHATTQISPILISVITVNTGYGDNAKHRPTVYSVWFVQTLKKRDYWGFFIHKLKWYQWILKWLNTWIIWYDVNAILQYIQFDLFKHKKYNKIQVDWYLVFIMREKDQKYWIVE